MEFGHFAIVLDAKTLQVQALGLAGLDRMRPVNEIAIRAVMRPQVIEAAVEMIDVDFGRKIVNEEKGRSEKNHATMSILSVAGRIGRGKLLQFGHARETRRDFSLVRARGQLASAVAQDNDRVVNGIGILLQPD